ncbi:MAG TPA: hypothetical protein VJ921_14830, partial [Vicinamibacteria bacterium]|nr:hypothetical protein [Vicinamibacteria bacterium]
PEDDRPMGLVCLAPEGSDTVRLHTFSGDEPVIEEKLSADGEKRQLTQGKCHGWQQLDWSRDGSVLFLRSELTCAEERARSITGMSFLADASTWVELQSIGSADGRAVLIRRFRAASDEVSRLHVPSLSEQQIRAAVDARFSSRPMTLEEVIEASSRVTPEVVEAALLERGGRFPLDSTNLARLSEASVPSSVIDLMVALSFPEKFAVEREGGGGGAGFGYAGYDPFFSSAFAYPYYFAPFGYYYWYYPGAPVYPYPPDGGVDGSVGRAVEGRGYTRVTRVDGPGSEERRAHRRGESGSGGSDSSKSGTGSSSGGSVSRGGYSRGGSQGGTAKPKKQ